jgi:hypothetical protein
MREADGRWDELVEREGNIPWTWERGYWSLTPNYTGIEDDKMWSNGSNENMSCVVMSRSDGYM